VSKKKRRRRPAGSKARPAPETAAPERDPAEQTPASRTERSATEDEERPEEERRGGVLTRALGDSPFPPLGISLARGLAAVGASPTILGLAFLSVLAVWGLFAALGTDAPPALMVNMLALPPVHVFFDAQILTATVQDVVGGLALTIGLTLLRAVTFGLLAMLTISAVRDGAPDVRVSVRRLPRLIGAFTLIYAFELGLILAVPVALQTIGGAQFGLLGILAVLLFGLHFLVLAPVAAASEGLSALESIRRSTRAARLPGMRHFLLALLYFFFVYWGATVIPVEALPPATPTLLTWMFVLVATLIHVAVLGAFAFRWLVVRENELVTAPRPRPRR
jgi:hypothetical protein